MEKEIAYSNTDKISVIVPVYKVEAYIEQCIDSILSQTYKNLEVILVDDGSPDCCPQICEEYALRDSRVKVVHKYNGGLSDARNFGMREATGEFISFVDSDDYIDIHMYETMMNGLHENECDIVECHCVKFCDIEKPDAIISDEVQILNSKEWLTESGLGEFISCVVWNKIYRRSLFQNIEFPVGRHYEDEATTYKVIYKAEKILRMNSAYYFYRQREGSITQLKASQRELDEKKQALEEKYLFFKEKQEVHIANFCGAKLAVFMVSSYSNRKKVASDAGKWYSLIRNIFFQIATDFSVPFKYKIYIGTFLICPPIIGK